MGPRTFLKNVLRPIAAFQGTGQIEFYQVSELFPEKCSGSWDGVSKPLGTCLGTGTMLARVPRPVAAYPEIEKDEFYQASGPFPENDLYPEMVFQRSLELA